MDLGCMVHAVFHDRKSLMSVNPALVCFGNSYLTSVYMANILGLYLLVYKCIYTMLLKLLHVTPEACSDNKVY